MGQSFEGGLFPRNEIVTTEKGIGGQWRNYKMLHIKHKCVKNATRLEIKGEPGMGREGQYSCKKGNVKGANGSVW